MKKIINSILAGSVLTSIGFIIGRYFEPHNEVKVDKYKSYYNMLCKWLEMEKEGKNAATLLKELGYVNIAVYGMGNIGKRLVESLKGTDVKVVCGVDSYSTNDENGIRVYDKDEQLPDVDAVIVTVPFAYETIKHDLGGRISVPVLSFEHILFEV